MVSLDFRTSAAISATMIRASTPTPRSGNRHQVDDAVRGSPLR